VQKWGRGEKKPSAAEGAGMPSRRTQVAFYEKEEPGLGARFSLEVEDATARAVAYPLSGSPTSKNTRRILVKDFPFSSASCHVKSISFTEPNAEWLRQKGT